MKPILCQRSLRIAAILLAAIASDARATTVTIPLDGQHQRASLLCWAATSAMAVNAFRIPDGQLTQQQLTVLAKLGLETRAEYDLLSAPLKSDLNTLIAHCDAHIANCDERRPTILPGLTFVTGAKGKALKWADLRMQIDASRPVIFTWVYAKTRLRKEFEHQFIILGYKEEGGTKQLLVWDPLPAKNPLSTVAHSVLKADKRRWISYDNYRNPRVDAGRRTEHGFTIYNLARENNTISLPLPVLGDTLRAPPLSPVSFGDALHEAEPTLRLIESELNAGAQPKRLGQPMPVIALEDGDLIEERDPTRLLAASTSTLLVPVQSGAVIDDAFLLIRVGDQWQRGGYVGFSVASALLAQRETSARDTHVSLDEFFAVALPQRATFFAAFGYREQARLIPISTDPAIGAYAGQPRLAGDQFTDLGRQILSLPRRNLSTEESLNRAGG